MGAHLSDEAILKENIAINESKRVDLYRAKGLANYNGGYDVRNNYKKYTEEQFNEELKSLNKENDKLQEKLK